MQGSPSWAQGNVDTVSLWWFWGDKVQGRALGRHVTHPEDPQEINFSPLEKALVSYHQRLLQICPGDSACKARGGSLGTENT